MMQDKSYGSTTDFVEPPTHGSAVGFAQPLLKSPLEVVAPYFAEFLGTFVLVFTAGTCSVVGDSTWNATAVASILAGCVYVFGPVSGGHLNPAVSFASGLAGKESWKKVLMYICLQLAGGICAGFAYASVLEQSTTVGPVAPFDKTMYPQIVELVYTAFLSFVVLNIVYSRRNNPEDDQNHFFGLAIGFVVVAGGYAGGNISGACFNPAIAVGLNAAGYSTHASSVWPYVYAGCEFAGGLVAAILFLMVRPEERRRHTDIQPNFDASLGVKLVSEFLGTFMLMLTVGLCVAMKSTATAWAAAASLMCAIYALGDVSGAHFNPAVTFSIVLSRRGKCPVLRGMCFIVIQVCAGLVAGLVAADVHNKGPNRSESFCLKPLTKTSASGKLEDYWEPVFWGEAIFTGLLCYTVLTVATTTPAASFTKQNFSFGLAIGACVTAGGFATGMVSGGELNPAVSVGITAMCKMSDATERGWPLTYLLNFTLFELAGGVGAAVIFALTHSHEHTHSYEKQLIMHHSQ